MSKLPPIENNLFCSQKKLFSTIYVFRIYISEQSFMHIYIYIYIYIYIKRVCIGVCLCEERERERERERESKGESKGGRGISDRSNGNKAIYTILHIHLTAQHIWQILSLVFFKSFFSEIS